MRRGVSIAIGASPARHPGVDEAPTGDRPFLIGEEAPKLRLQHVVLHCRLEPPRLRQSPEAPDTPGFRSRLPRGVDLEHRGVEPVDDRPGAQQTTA